MTTGPLQIGSLTLDSPWVLAPMAGYTKAPFRTICLAHHCGLVFTEVVSASGIIHGSPQTLAYLETFGERPIGAHIYGPEPEILAEAAHIVEAMGRFDLIDVNCGCPVPKVASKGSGVALMQDPHKIQRIVEAVRASVSLPVTVKTRLGLSREAFNIAEVARAAEEGGASALFLHARFATDKHRGPADWNALRQIKAAAGIPVIGNGGVTHAEHALEMIQETGVDGVMIARGALGNPWIFDHIHCLSAGAPYTPPTAEARRAVITDHLEKLHRLIEKGPRRRRPRRATYEQIACRRFRGHLVKYLAGLPGLRDLRQRLMQLETIDELMAAVEQVLEVA